MRRSSNINMHVENQVTFKGSNPHAASHFRCGSFDAHIPPYPGQVLVSLEYNFLHLLVWIKKEIHDFRTLFDCVS